MTSPPTTITSAGRPVFQLWEQSAEDEAGTVTAGDAYHLVFGRGMVLDGENIFLENDGLLAFSPYWTGELALPAGTHVFGITFHSDFFCIYKNEREVGAERLLFRDFGRQPGCPVADLTTYHSLFNLMRSEAGALEVGYHEVIVNLLKVCLIRAGREKERHDRRTDYRRTGEFPPEVLQFLELVEAHYAELHRVGEYATRLHLTAATLNRLTKTHLGVRASDLIARRVIQHAKRELYLSAEPIKTVAAELGYGDEFYFSRFFKKRVGVSPTVYRRTVGKGRRALLVE